jgi:hypothetical protein
VFCLAYVGWDEQFYRNVVALFHYTPVGAIR